MCVCGGVCIVAAACAMGGGAFGSAAAVKNLGEGDNDETASTGAVNTGTGIGELCAKMTALKMSVQQSALKIARQNGLAKGSRRVAAPLAPAQGDAGTDAGEEDDSDALFGSCTLPWEDMQPSRVMKTKRVRDDGRSRRRGSPALAKIVQGKLETQAEEVEGPAIGAARPGPSPHGPTVESHTWDAFETLGS